MKLAILFVYGFYLYLTIGLMFSVWFVVKGVDKVDGGVSGSPWKLRLLLLPGSVLLWPVLLRKYLRSA
ncbi:MAG: hypothetical protein GC192_04280 [Bacteroidetes bacterium]|nr:hypothetical protein [Bacteroidota bacterium]